MLPLLSAVTARLLRRWVMKFRRLSRRNHLHFFMKNVRSTLASVLAWQWFPSLMQSRVLLGGRFPMSMLLRFGLHLHINQY